MNRPVRGRRRWWIVAPTLLVIAIGLLWTGGWFYAASLADHSWAEWRAREAKAGHDYRCGEQEVGGYPFRIEFRCSEPLAEWHDRAGRAAFKAQSLTVTMQVFNPKLLVSEMTGPLAIGEPGQAPQFLARWKLAQASLRGTPGTPERVSVAIDSPSISRPDGSEAVFTAQHAEFHSRIAEGSPSNNPVLDLVLRLTAATAPSVHPLTRAPIDAEVSAVLRGLADFSPKPWSERLREMQARGGKIEITSARVEQGDVLAVGAGTIGLTPRGNLDGELRITVVGLEKVLKTLDVQQMMTQGDVGTALSALDRILPGFGQFARQNAEPSLLAGLGAMGQATTLEGRKAVALPLRFADGAVLLGPIPVGRTPPVF